MRQAAACKSPDWCALFAAKKNKSQVPMRLDQARIIDGPASASDPALGWGAAASVSLHALLAVLLLFVVHATRLPPLVGEGVPVELITLPPLAPADGGRVPASLPSPAPAVPAMITASHMLSDTALDGSVNGQARRAFGKLTGEERLQQLCNLEALSQLRAWNATLRPDRLVAYAMGEARLSGDLLSADGAAFHNGAGWWRLRYRCGLTPDHLRVASFQFAVGDAIPRSQWQAHNLPTPEGADPD
jgi:hypothetical protein